MLRDTQLSKPHNYRDLQNQDHARWHTKITSHVGQKPAI
jgi:hypothetical protein